MEIFLNRYHLLQATGFEKEYLKLRSLTPSDLKRLTPVTRDISHRNRYGNILTYDDTRVKLKTKTKEECDYINASYCEVNKMKTIVSQGPLSHTADHFWKMAWEQNSNLIIMLTDFTEGRKEKCYPYFPRDVDTLITETDSYIITVKSLTELCKGWINRSLLIEEKQTRETKEITHIHCFQWPDFGSLDKEQLEGLIRALEICEEVRSEGGLPIVHCSAGVGRSGTFVAIEALLQVGKKNQWDLVDPFKVVVTLRNQRPGMVQTCEQYQMIYDVLKLLLCD